MAVAFDVATAGETSAAGTTLSFNHTNNGGSDRFLLVCVFLRGGVSGAVSTVKYGGSDLTYMDWNNSGTTIRLEAWKLLTPATGTNAVDIVTADTWQIIAATALSYTGVDLNDPHTSPLDGAAANSNAVSTGPYTSATGQKVIDMAVQKRDNDADGFAGNAGAGQTVRNSGSATSSTQWMHWGVSEKDGAASVTMTWAPGQNNVWSTLMVGLKPSAGGIVKLGHGMIGRNWG